MRFYGSRWQPEFNDCDIAATTVTDVVVPPHGRRDDDDETW